ncbi:unnamed protein product [Onchocerca flexuosa]|uniref:Uncharacterized protein n=1 Tax=Onchocerca flexuosa TaxID=387005 RepID=A0A183H2W6_9BILA|nr:unnamed protein product [Onchocerca flexuosa]
MWSASFYSSSPAKDNVWCSSSPSEQSYSSFESEKKMPKYEIQVQVPRVNKNGFERSQSQMLTDEYEEFSDPTLSFERNRIKQLQDERVHIQKKTFTKWCNSFLNRVSF